MRGIFISGPHHILHNLTEDLPNVLVWWSIFIEFLKAVTQLLSQPWTRERLVASCFSDGPQQVMAADIGSFNARVYDKRWGTALNANHLLLNVKLALALGWDKAKYLNAHGQAPRANRQQGNTQDPVSVNTVSLVPLLS